MRIGNWKFVGWLPRFGISFPVDVNLNAKRGHISIGIGRHSYGFFDMRKFADVENVTSDSKVLWNYITCTIDETDGWSPCEVDDVHWANGDNCEHCDCMLPADEEDEEDTEPEIDEHDVIIGILDKYIEIADRDFLEYLLEQSWDFDNLPGNYRSMTDQVYLYYAEWAKENVEKILL